MNRSKEKNTMFVSRRSQYGLFLLTILLACTLAGAGARADGLRLRSLGGATLAIEDRDNGINPFDFGRNPAWLGNDFDYQYIRFIANLDETSGDLRRLYDPGVINDFYVGFSGIKSLSDRQVVSGYIDYQRLQDRETPFNLESDQYNDVFYLTDQTIGDFEYYGPRTSVDYSLRLRDDLYIGAGFDYEINTGLKQEYTRPQIVHNYFRGYFGLTWQPSSEWVLGASYIPTRLQDRTKFEKPDEGFDNVVLIYSGDDIYELRAFSSQQFMETMYSHVFSAQAFYMTGDLSAGLIGKVGTKDNELKYSPSRMYEKGYWEQTLYELDLRARYAPEGTNWALGLTGGIKSDDGWGVRPDFDEVLLYDNPYRVYRAGFGAAYRIAPVDVTLIGEYVLEKNDIEANDYGAGLTRKSDAVTNIGRLGVEKRILNVYSFRAGFELTDYPIDRWLKLPQNIDIYRYTAGIGYYIGGWEIDLHLMYADWRKDDTDRERNEMGAVLWFTRIVGGI